MKSRKKKERLFTLGEDESLFHTLAPKLFSFHVLSAFFFTSYNIER